MLFIIIGLASIGTANTLLMNTYEREFEIGTMRALGFTKQQIRNMILAEGLLIGLSVVTVGIATVVVLIYVTSKSKMMEGFISFQFPNSIIILAMLAGISLSFCAAWIFSKTASKLDIQLSLKKVDKLSVKHGILTLLYLKKQREMIIKEVMELTNLKTELLLQGDKINIY